MTVTNTNENTKKRGNKLLKVCAVLIGLLLIWNTAVRFLAYPVYARLYFLPRLKVSVNLTVDGEPYRLERDAVQGLPRDDLQKDISRIAWFQAKNAGCRFREWNDSYISNPFQIRIQTDSMQTPKYIPVDVNSGGSYDLAQYNVEINVNTKSGSYTYTGSGRKGKEQWDAHKGSGTLLDEDELAYSVYCTNYIDLGGD